MKHLKDSLSYLSWRLKQNHIKPSNKDLNALNVLVKALNELMELKQQDNQQLVKFMIHFFNSYLSESIVNNKHQHLDFRGANEKIDEVFKMDVNSHLKKLKENINGCQMDVMITQNKLTPENIQKRSTQDQVNKSMNLTINQFLHQYAT